MTGELDTIAYAHGLTVAVVVGHGLTEVGVGKVLEVGHVGLVGAGIARGLDFLGLRGNVRIPIEATRSSRVRIIDA